MKDRTIILLSIFAIIFIQIIGFLCMGLLIHYHSSSRIILAKPREIRTFQEETRPRENSRTNDGRRIFSPDERKNN